MKVYLAKFLRFVKSRKFIQKNSRVFGLAKVSPIKVFESKGNILLDASLQNEMMSEKQIRKEQKVIFGLKKIFTSYIGKGMTASDFKEVF